MLEYQRITDCVKIYIMRIGHEKRKDNIDKLAFTRALVFFAYDGASKDICVTYLGIISDDATGIEYFEYIAYLS